MDEQGERREKQALAAEAWRRIFGFFMSTRPQRDRVLEKWRLTPNDARALTALDEHEGRSMRSLAEAWGCEASNATWMVDRLEKRGLSERHSTTLDRRIKLVRLTPQGVALKAELLSGMNQPPPELLALAVEDLRALLDALQHLPTDDTYGSK